HARPRAYVGEVCTHRETSIVELGHEPCQRARTLRRIRLVCHLDYHISIHHGPSSSSLIARRHKGPVSVLSTLLAQPLKDRPKPSSSPMWRLLLVKLRGPARASWFRVGLTLTIRVMAPQTMGGTTHHFGVCAPSQFTCTKLRYSATAWNRRTSATDAPAR